MSIAVRPHRAVLCLLAAFAVGCGGSPEPVDGGETDSASDASVDGGATCTRDAECDDGLFCNGVERCTGGRCGAGTVPDCADAIACTRDECSEDRRTCLHSVPDMDTDGHGDIACVDAAGVPLGDDCDDTDAMTFPDAIEVCDAAAHDEDCDPTTHGRIDADSDGFEAARCCNGSSCGTDCNDGVRGANPDATEVCNGIDDDCDSLIDEMVSVAGFADDDRDGFGDDARPLSSCGDAAGFSTRPGDCDDTSIEVNAGQLEFCDGVDNDCDGRIDEMATDVTWYRDADGDGFGTAGTTMLSCTRPPGHSILGTDCDDTTSSRSPRAAEVCNAIDDDCNGRADFVISPGNLEDDDGDLVADTGCGLPRGLDCDDLNPSVRPGAAEICNGADDDCDAVVDEGSTSVTFHRDSDHDGYGDPGTAVIGCFAPAGYVVDATDCDDRSAVRHPGAVEICDAIDGDCDHHIDETPAESSCSIPHAIALCTVGICHVDACAAGWDDCTLAPGCETRTTSDPLHCGSCTACPSGDLCAAGVCLPNAGYVGFTASDGDEAVTAVAVASDDSFVVAGRYTGSFVSACGTLPLSSSVSGYIERHRSDGSCDSLIGLQGAMNDEITGVAFDSSGNLYVTFKTSSDSVAFSTGGAVARAAGQGGQDAVVASFDPSGLLRWSFRFGGAGADAANALAVLGTHVFVAGGVHAPVVLDATRSLPMRDGSLDATVLQLDAATGALVAATAAVPNGAAVGDDEATTVSVDTNTGDAFVGGLVSVPTFFGGTDRILSVAGPTDGFVWRVTVDTLASAGVIPVTGPGRETVTGVSVDGPYLYVGGTFIGSTSFQGSPLSAHGGVADTDGFVFGTDIIAGIPFLARAIGGPAVDGVSGLASAFGRLGIVGTMGAGYTDIGGFGMEGTGGTDGFGLTLEPIMGFPIGAEVLAGPSDSFGYSVSVGSYDMVFGGEFSGPVTVLGDPYPDVGGGTDGVWVRVSSGGIK